MNYKLKDGTVRDIITMQEDKDRCLYKHFKGNVYRVLYIGKHSETLDTYVIYQSLDNEKDIWIRPIDMFLSKVDKAKYPNVKQEYRFEQIKNI